ncbi:hypothetical protein EC9_14000 [Rosistilla ulvae]|uniref:Uncharacterized protein n=1 Tax=Rosistilla ulvae TaxID=1930277 RepID=A0A517LX92_9BACT|nr:hypothetical protein EC9_14000 [Rosistilla ulvae]
MRDLNKGDCDNLAQPRQRPRVARRATQQCVLAMSAVLLTTALTGCANVQGVFGSCDCSLNRSLHMTRAELMARRVWSYKYSDCHENHSNARDVRRGFIDGFVDIASGKDGCPPVFPPQNECCLTGPLRSPVNQCRDQAWFQGYPLGVAAAKQQGCHLWWRSNLPAHLIAQYQSANCTSCGSTDCESTGCCGPTGCVIDQERGEASSSVLTQAKSQPTDLEPFTNREAGDSEMTVRSDNAPFVSRSKRIPTSVRPAKFPANDAAPNWPATATSLNLRNSSNVSEQDSHDVVSIKLSVKDESNPIYRQTSSDSVSE